MVGLGVKRSQQDGPLGDRQRINLGLFAILGEMNATANWRAISEEIWPFVAAPPSTPMGEAEEGWHAAASLAR